MQDNTTVSVIGEQIEILLPSRMANNAGCVGVQTSPPGGGPPPHMHLREEEFFKVLDGEFDFFDGERWTPFAPGEVKC